MDKTGVPIKFRPLSKGYLWLLALVFILTIGNSGTWVLFLIVLFIAYLDSDKAIAESRKVSRRIEEAYGLKPSGWGEFMLLLVVNEMQQRVNLGPVWSVDGLKRVTNVYAVTEGDLLRLITPVKNDSGSETFREIPLRSSTSPTNATTNNLANPEGSNANNVATKEKPIDLAKDTQP